MTKARPVAITYRIGLSPETRHAVVAAFDKSDGRKEFFDMMAKFDGYYRYQHLPTRKPLPYHILSIQPNAALNTTERRNG